MPEPYAPAELQEFLQALEVEQPLGMAYVDEAPEEGAAPKECRLPTREDEAAGPLDWGQLSATWSCLFRHLVATRRSGKPAWFGASNFGCLGAAFFLGWQQKQLDAVAAYISTGTPFMEGERYLPGPEASHEFFGEIAPRPAPKAYCLFKPVTAFAADDPPEVVTFFADAEHMSGLHQLAAFTTRDMHAVVSPFGSGCANIVSWPLQYVERGERKAVLGGWDPSMRMYLGVNELTLSMPRTLFEDMVAGWRDSFLTGHAWSKGAGKRKRARRLEKRKAGPA